MSLTISHTAKTYPKRLPYADIAKTILGAKYDVSLVFVGADRAQAINQATRGKSYVPNVLSFPLIDSAGEIYICPVVAKKEASKFNLTPNGYIGYLFIHGCLHLKGLDHGEQMDKLETKYVKQFNLQ